MWGFMWFPNDIPVQQWEHRSGWGSVLCQVGNGVDEVYLACDIRNEPDWVPARPAVIIRIHLEGVSGVRRAGSINCKFFLVMIGVFASCVVGVVVEEHGMGRYQSWSASGFGMHSQWLVWGLSDGKDPFD